MNKVIVQSIKISFWFIFFGIIFAISNHIVLPWIASKSTINPFILAQIVNSAILFIPILITGLLLIKSETLSLKWQAIKNYLFLKKPEKNDYWVMFISLFIAVAIILFIIGLLSLIGVNLEQFENISPITLRPLEGIELLFILFMPISFFFNYVGEELLWRGVLFKRQEPIYHQYTWIINGILHGIFHMYMGPLALILSPIFLSIAYTYKKTKNLYVVIIMHAIIGAPTDLLLALGIIS